MNATVLKEKSKTNTTMQAIGTDEELSDEELLSVIGGASVKPKGCSQIQAACYYTVLENGQCVTKSSEECFKSLKAQYIKFRGK